ncbi:MAG: hypothetical protein ACRDIV_18840 [Ktedonobacteraceae bacterium]
MDNDELVRSYFASIRVPTLPAGPIVLHGLLPVARKYLEQHGCTITEQDGEITVTYPAGTTSREILPRTMYEWFKIVLPDGTELQEARPFLISSENCLFLPKDILKDRG